MKELIPCPFCGRGWHRKELGVFILWHEPTCVFGGPNGVVHSTTMDDLFAIKWNTRATDPLLKQMAEALECIIEDLSHGLQESRASKCTKKALQSYRAHINQIEKPECEGE